jgi:hypothetical protein
MSKRFKVEIHYVMGETICIDTVKVPKGGNWISHLKERGRTVVAIRDRRNRKVRALQYRQVEKMNWMPIK